MPARTVLVVVAAAWVCNFSHVSWRVELARERESASFARGFAPPSWPGRVLLALFPRLWECEDDLAGRLLSWRCVGDKRRRREDAFGFPLVNEAHQGASRSLFAFFVCCEFCFHSRRRERARGVIAPNRALRADPLRRLDAFSELMCREKLRVLQILF